MAGYYQIYCSGGCGQYFHEESANYKKALEDAREHHDRLMKNGLQCAGANLDGPVILITEEEQRRQRVKDDDGDWY